ETSAIDAHQEDGKVSHQEDGKVSHQEDGKATRRRPEGSFVSQHASFWENPSSQHVVPSRTRTNIPTRYMGDLSAKINATRQKFNQNSSARGAADSSATPGPKPKSDPTTDEVAKKIRPGRADFGQLLQKFSGSESGSEKSDTEHGLVGQHHIRKTLMRSPKGEEIVSSGEESDSARRTPERTQSLKLSAVASKFGGTIEKSSSFRSDFMNSRMAKIAAEHPKEATNRLAEMDKLVSDNLIASKVQYSGLKQEQTPSNSLVKTDTATLSTGQKSSGLVEGFGVKLDTFSNVSSGPELFPTTEPHALIGVDFTTTETPSTQPKRAYLHSDVGSITSLSSSRDPVSKLSNSVLKSSEIPKSSKERGSDSMLKYSELRANMLKKDAAKIDNENSNSDSTAGVIGSNSRAAYSLVNTDSKKDATHSSTLLRQSINRAHSSETTIGNLDKSMEILSRVTEELDHPERPSSLPTSPLDLKSPAAKARSPSFDEAEKFIKNVETSITSMSSRWSPDKIQSLGATSFTFKGNETDLKRPEQIDLRANCNTEIPKPDARFHPIDRTGEGDNPKETNSTLTPKSSSGRSVSSQSSVERSNPVKDTITKPDQTILSDNTLERISPAIDVLPTHGSASVSSSAAVTSVTKQSSIISPSTSSKQSTTAVLTPTPSRVTSDLKASVSEKNAAASQESSGQRISSFKDYLAGKTESDDKRKGILKRSSSLKKDDDSGSTFPVVDPQLAKILQQRKQIVGDVREEEEERKIVKEGVGVERKRTLSAAEEIQENLKYSKLKAAEQGKDPDDDEVLKTMTVAERVLYMQSKIEEEKFAAVTPKSRSGVSTPRSRPRSGFITPTFMKSVEEETVPHHMPTSLSSPAISSTATEGTTLVRSRKNSLVEQQQGQQLNTLSGPRLIEKLAEIADSTDAFQERRLRFQTRSRNDWRHQTQPVTLDEINAADSLETVSAFRALVRKKTSINAFDQLKAQTSSSLLKPQAGVALKKAEFPHDLVPPPKHQRKGRRLRHRTLPVTAEELNAVPEHQMLIMQPDWAKTEDLEKRDSKADSGILSGSDIDLLCGSVEHLQGGMDTADNDPSRMSISERASFFKGLEEKSKAERDKEKSASGAKRYIMRKKRERSQTMPITEDEVKTASEMGESTSSRWRVGGLAQTETSVSRSRSTSISEEGEQEHEEDQLVKLSLSEKVKLFSQLKDKEEQPPPKTEAPVIKRRNRKQASRFSTQPVTSEEVEQAAAYSRISPLAMSMVKPPDPEMLKGLPLKDQRDLMAQHAEMFLSQNSIRSQSRSGSATSLSQPSSRRTSVSIEDGEVWKTEGGEVERGEKRGILKDKSASTKDLNDFKSILKSEPSKAKSEPEVHSILKGSIDSKHLETTTSSLELRGILKKAKSEDIPSMDSAEEIRGILRHIDSDDEEPHGKPRSRSNSQPFGILKREPSPQPSEQSLEIRSILKTPSHENVLEGIKSAMRRGSAEYDSSTQGASVLRSAFKNRGAKSDMEESHGEISAMTELKSSIHRIHVEHDGDMNDTNSHLHVDLTISVADHTSTSLTSKSKNASLSSDTSTSSSYSSFHCTKTSSSCEGMTASSTARSLSQGATASANNNMETLHVPEDAESKGGTSASEGEGESSAGELLDTPRSTTSKLKRRSRLERTSSNAERYRTRPSELAADSAATPTDQPRRKAKYYDARHKTQPITPDEMREAEATTPGANLTRTPGGSISDRLNQLKASGEEEWKKRVGKKDDLGQPLDALVKLREKPGIKDARPNSIADRLNELEYSKTTWTQRVEESDAKQFTVAAKLANNVTESPLVNKLKNLPKREDSGSIGSSPLASPVTPTKEFISKIPLPKDIVQDPTVIIESPKKVSESEEKREPVKVEVPNIGEEMETFFNVKSIDDIKDRVKLEIDDFDNIFIDSEDILTSVHKIRPQRKVRPSSHNPLKTMSMKVELLQEYTEVTYGIAEKELRRVKREGLAKDAGFAEAALAGLASKENFKQVELRRTDSGSSVHGVVLEPFKELMLLHVKGRRTIQVRLVEPHTRSLNAGDCYILVCPDKVIHWEGQFANVIEKAKASEIAAYIQTKKDLGCKKANEVFTVYQNKDHLGAGKLFWSALEGEKQCQACGPDAEDELYETSITKANMVYRLEGNALLPYTEYWGDIPKHEMLKKNEVIVFDFGTEFYLWQGKSVTMDQRRLGLKLAKQLFEKGYDYTQSVINPISPLKTEDHGGLPVKADKRPSWTIFGKVSQNMETILFREKFADWPDSSRIIGCKGLDVSGTDSVNKDIQELKPYDAKLMIPLNTYPVTLKLDGSDLGRGVKWTEDMQGFIKEQDIITINVATWHVLEYDHFKLPSTSHGQFHDGDTYVVRWQYMIANSNLRTLKGAARNVPKGRERCAYFFWQGSNSTINEKGASALMTVELDEERGPQVRVLQGKEYPCFLNLFNGSMVVHIGKREDPATNTQGAWRLYCLRGDYENEACLVEIPVCLEHLRSRSSLVLLNINTGIVYIWHGVKSPKHVRVLCRKVVDKWREKTPLEFSLHKNAVITITEVEEGEEKREIWAALDSRDRTLYNSLITDPKPYTHTIRLFQMSSVNMIFEVHEQLNLSRVPDLTTPFPFLQADLYRSTQPALFLLDNDHEVYLWQGWWPIGSHDTDNVHTGSATARFNMDRRCAMETTLHYCREKLPEKPPTAYLVCAGVEPKSFISLFPFWVVDTVVRDISLEEGKPEDYMEKVSAVLHRLTKTRYT
ncbi:unnamed protein product, partial [Lymnaea stagnalis]